MHWYEGPSSPVKFRGGSLLRVRNDRRKGGHRVGCMSSHRDNIWAHISIVKTRWQGLSTISCKAVITIKTRKVRACAEEEPRRLSTGKGTDDEQCCCPCEQEK